MAQASLFIQPDPQFFDNNGVPLAGGVLYFYAAGTSNPKAVYADSGEITSLGTSVTLDSSGRAKIWLDGYYKVVLNDFLGNLIWTEDNVSSAFSPAAASVSNSSQWAVQSDTLTYIGATQFSVPGDKTSAYLVGNRIQATVTAGAITGTITVSAAGGSPIKTTVTVLWDLSHALDSGLSAVSVGIISASAGASPFQIPVGGHLGYLKGFTGCPPLPYNFVEMNGQTLSNPLSPFNGQVIPNWNGAAAGADTLGNGKIAVYIRGGATSGSYSADAIKIHQHGVTTITVNNHAHPLSGGVATAGATSGTESAAHTHRSADNVTPVGGGGSPSGILQNGTGSITQYTGTEIGTHTHAITLSGATDYSPSTGITGLTDNNGAATETIPKTVTSVYILRIF